MSDALAPLRVRIAGSGKYVPERVVENAELEERWGLARGWIFERTGIERRRYVADDEGTIELASRAAQGALADAGVDVKDVDVVVGACAVQHQALPTTSSFVAHALGRSGAACMDVNASCFSFGAALFQTSLALAHGTFDTALVFSADLGSRGADPEDPRSACLLGDGAAAVVLRRTRDDDDEHANDEHGSDEHASDEHASDEHASDKHSSALSSSAIRVSAAHASALRASAVRASAVRASAVRAFHMRTYPEGRHDAQIRAGGTGILPDRPGFQPRAFRFQMNGKAIFKLALTHAAPFLDELFAKSPIARDAIDVVIPHQTNAHGVQAFSRWLGFEADRVVSTFADHGNCVGAALPMALHDAIASKKLVRGQNALICGTAAGLTLGALVLTY